MYLIISFALLIIGIIAYRWAYRGALQAAMKGAKLHSRPVYHGAYLAITVVTPGLLILIFWVLLSPSIIHNWVESLIAQAAPALDSLRIATIVREASGGAAMISDTAQYDGLIELAEENFRNLTGLSDILLVFVIFLAVVAAAFFGAGRIRAEFKARHFVEKAMWLVMFIASIVAILTTIGIVLSLLFESIRFFGKVNFFDFLFGFHWSPQSEFEAAGAEAIAANSQVFGAVPLLAGTALITFIAIMVAAPVGLFSAIYLSDYASKRMRAIAKPSLEILAGIPTVVYGFFAALIMAPFFRDIGNSAGITVSSESALAAGIVMGVMIIPFISSLSDDVISAVPQALRDGAAALGSTKAETVRLVVLPAALPGIMSALILAISRAVGETMIVVMAAGLAANLTLNPLEAVTTVTVQIVTLLVGDQEFDSAKTLAAFALGLMLFTITLILNIVALSIVRRYKEQYE